MPVRGNRKQYAVQAVNILLQALKNPKYAETLNEELSGMLFPGAKNTGIGEIARELEHIARHYGGTDG